MDSHEEEKKEIPEHDVKEHKVPKNKESIFLKNMRKNPWIITSFILAILVLILVFSGVSLGHHVSKQKAVDSLISFYGAQGITGLELSSIEKQHGVYAINLTYQNQTVPFYVTKDGYLTGNSLVELLDTKTDDNSNSETQTQEIPKKDIPEVELYIMAKCPFGTQAEKGIVPALELLGDKVNFNLRFVSYSMHGKEEIDQNTRLYCVQKEAPEKLFDYMKCYLGEDNPEAWDTTCYTDNGIDKAVIDNCVSSTDNDFNITALFDDKSTWRGGRYSQYNVDESLNEQYGVQGSPALVINDVKLNPIRESDGNYYYYLNFGEGVQKIEALRDPASYLDIICQSFTDGNVPEECGQELDSTSPSSGFGYGSSGSGSTGSCS